MEYEAQNYTLLNQIYKEFSHFFSYGRISNDLDLEVISKVYAPYSEIEVDEVANAICWCSSSLKTLQERRPIRCLDEVLSFAESVLKRQ